MKNLTLRYSLHQGFYWAAAAGVLSFASTYLLSKGFSPAQVGVLLAVSSLLSCTSQPFIASIADRARNNILPRMVLILTGLCMISFGSLILFPVPLPVLGLLFLLGVWAFDVMNPLMNSIHVHYGTSGYPMNYGVARGVGSLAFSLAALLLGYVIRFAGADAMLFAVLGALVCVVVTVAGYPRTGASLQPRHAAADCCSVGVFFVRYRWYCVSLTGIAFLAMFHVMTENYLIAIMERLGGNSSHVGTALFLSSASAVPVLFLFSRIRQRIPDQWLLKIAGLSFLLKGIVFLLAPNILTIYAAQLLQTTSYAFLSPVQVFYAKQKVSPADMVKGQSFITAFYALGCALGNLLGGTLIEQFGVLTMLVIAVVIAAFGTAILFLTVGKADASGVK